MFHLYLMQVIFLTLANDFSRDVWVFLLKFMNEANNFLIKFHNIIKTQFGKTIQRTCTDNGGEFTSNDMQRFYNEHAILIETTCPHPPPPRKCSCGKKTWAFA